MKIVLVILLAILPDSVWTFKNQNEHHHVEANEIWLSADRPGAGTGSEVLDRGYIHYHINMDFGITYVVHPRVQLDAYAGFNLYNSEPIISFPQNYAFFGLGVTWLIWHPI